MAYTKTEWYVQAPITQESMNKIEQGIYDAHQNIETANGNIRDMSTRIGGVETRVGDAETDITNIRSSISNMTSNADDGRKAWAQVSGAITMNGDVVTKSLNDRIGDIEGKQNTMQIEITNAHRDNGDSLVKRFESNERDINSAFGAINSLNNDYDEAAGGHESLNIRLNSDESRIGTNENAIGSIQQEIINARGSGNNELKDHFDNIDNQLKNAKNSSVKSTVFETVDERFEDLETELVNARGGQSDLDARLDKIDDLSRDNSLVKRMSNAESRLDTDEALIVEAQGNISALRSGKVNVGDVENAVDIDVAGKVLDARVGKTLQDQITTLQQNASTEGGRIDALEAELAMSEQDGERRLDDIEAEVSGHTTEIENAHVSTANDTSYGSIDARFEAAETKANTMESDLSDVSTLANQLQSDLQTIANELDMVHNDQITGTNTRIDTLEETVGGLSATLGDQSDFGQRIADAESDIDDLQDRMGSIEGTVTGANGLQDRMLAAEQAISHAAGNDDPGGLTQRMDAVETAVANAQATANNAATQTSVTNLTNRVTALEGKDTVIIDNATFDEETGLPTSIGSGVTPSENCDYLIKGADDKYYYWRYFGAQTGWQLISGAGGGGGNSSGYDFDTLEDYAALEEYSENTDYYVQSDDGVHHYRWVQQTNLDTGEDELVQIEIGCVTDTSNIKKYNVAVETLTNESDGTTTNYLNLYEFDANESNTIDPNDEENEITRLENKRIRHILLPATGGGGSLASMKFSRITSRLFTSALGGDDPITVKFFFTTGEANDGAYYDLYIGRIETVGNTTRVVDERKVINNEAITSGDPQDKATTWPTKQIEQNGEIITVPMSTSEVPQGFYSIDVTDYFTQVGYYSIRITARSSDNTSLTGGIDWQLHTINFYLTSDSEDGLIVSSTDEVSISYKAFGAVDKTLHVIIDNDTEHQITKSLPASSSGRLDSIDIPTQSHGLHKIDMYADALINNTTIPTKHIYREYIWYDANDEDAAPIIVASRYNNQTINTEAYTEFNIPYSVYHKEDTNYLVEYYRDYGTENEILLEQVNCRGNVISSYDYIPITAGNNTEVHTITIKVADQTATITLNVRPIQQDVSPIAGAIIDFDPTGLTNSSLGREPEWKTKTTAFDDYPTWTPNITYGVNAHVIYDGYAYVCRTQNKDEVWTPEHWTEEGAYKYTFKVSDNFNWSNDASGGGYKQDEDGKCFVIKAGSYVDINYKMFKAVGGQSAIYENGAEMKIIFKTKAVRKADAVWFTNAKKVNQKDIGIQLSAHQGWLKTDKASDGAVSGSTDDYADWVSGTHYDPDDIVVYKRADDGTIYKCLTANEDVKLDKSKWLKLGQIERSVDATNTYLYFPYSEEDRIELDININKHITDKKGKAIEDFIMSYEDGVPSKALPYTYGPGGDGLDHPTGEEATIHIGSPDCDVYIYRLRIYNKSLGTDEILQNFIADGKTVQEKVARYERNSIYWDEEHSKFFTTPSGTAKLDPIKLAEKMPGVKILMLDAPTFTLHKKSLIRDTSLRCLQIQQDANGNFIYPEEGNWFFDKGYHAGQGTTSDNYGQAGRNLDFLFECDGVHYPANPKDMTDWTTDGTYKSELYRGNEGSVWTKVIDATDDEPAIYAWRPAEGLEPEKCTDWRGDDCKIQLTSTSVPNNYFNLKVNIASSENVNNALFQKRYNEYIQLLSASPATANQEAYHHYSTDERFNGPISVKNTMEFVPAVIFLRENSANLDEHVEFKDRDWHFYALGNIGDSKKTDYTRAYDPTDANEFTLEISDNNTNNSQFQSGVYEDNGQQVVEQADGSISTSNYIWGITDEQWNATRSPNADELATRAAINGGAEAVDVIMGGEQEDGSDGLVYVNYRHRMLSSEPFDGDHSFEFRYASQGSYRDGKIINPKDKNDAEYKAIKAQEKLNRRVFEAFYSWLVTANDTQFQEEANLWFVPRAMAFFYAFTHYYTMMDNRAKNTFWHFAKTGTRHPVPIGRAVKALMHVYEESDGNGGYQPASGDFDNTKQYYTQYAFDLWVYDCDTAAGIDNNGALVFPYGKEDTDYRTEGDPLSGSAFNGAGSIFWRRLSRTFASEIRDVMTQAHVNCFNAQHLINQFDETQACYPEEVWRLDIERKYIRTFTGVSDIHPYDNAVAEGKQNPRFLRSMMQGRKKYQRRQWIRDQGVYFNSKYRLNDIIKNENTIEFNATTPDLPLWTANTQYYINDYVRTRVEPFDELHPQFKVYRCITANNDRTFTPANWQESVAPSYLLSLVPFQDMYLNVQVGNGNYKTSYITDGEPTLRAKAGQEYIFDISGNKQETRIYINGGNHLSAIGNLAPMYPYEFDLRALAHLKNLDIGTDDPTYVNTKFVSLGLETDKPLLESINVKNCHSLGGALNLSNASNIRTVEAAGSSITTVNLPEYSNIETLHLPITTTDIYLYAARQLTDFQVIDSNGNIDYSNITKLTVVDSDYAANINWIDIALDMIDTSTTVKLLDLRQSSIDKLEDIEPFRVRKQLIETGAAAIVLSGNVTVNGEWSEIEKAQYEELWDDLHFLVIDDPEHKKVKHKLTYVYEVDGIQHEYSKYVNNNATIEDIYTEGIITEMPTKEVTAEKTYVFGTQENDVYIEFTGWRVRGDEKTLYERYETDGFVPKVTTNTVVEPVFTGTDRKYYIRWYLKSTDTTPIKTAGPYNYGTGEASEAPTVTDIQTAGRETCSFLFNRETNPVMVEYHIFNGWSKLPIKIAPEEIRDNFINIYGVWIDGYSDLDTLFADTSNMTPEQLYVFAHMSDAERARYADVGKQITMNVGYTGSDNSGTLLIGPGATYVMTTDQNRTATYPIARFNSVSDHAFRANIQPLKADNDEFTLVIDYSFDATALEEQADMTEAVLVSCYEKGSSVAGFKLYHYRANGLAGPRLSFGDTSLTNGQTNQSVLLGLSSTAKYRNTIVLRHPKNSTKLYVYSGINGIAQGNGLSAGNMLIDMKNTTAIQEITWNNVNTDAYLVFGNVEFGNTSTTVVGAKGTIYWAKYWNKDLGVGECRNLACWNHEKMIFAIEEFAGMNPKYAGRFVFPTGGSLPNVVLTSVTASSYGHIILDGDKNAAEGHTIQWKDSALQSVANKRIFWSLPTALQSIITKSPVRSRASVQSSTSYNSTHSIAGTDVVTTNDYVFLPSCVEVGLSDTTIYKTHEALNSMRWYSGGNTAVYRWDSGSTSWSQETGGNAQYMNLRFPVVAIKTDDPEDEIINNVYYGYSSSTTSIYEAIGGQEVIQRGDIFIHTNGTAYMYVTADDIAAGANIIYATATNNKFYYCGGRGGWIPADSYWLRSPFDNNGTSGTFMFVKKNGELQAGAVNKTTDGHGFSYSFSI